MTKTIARAGLVAMTTMLFAACIADPAEERTTERDAPLQASGPGVSAEAAADERKPTDVADACCDPADEPGQHGNPYCFEGATCCANGTWACNDGDGSPSCDAVGEVCEAKCCDAADEPGQNGNPYCFEGATCCADGSWACNDGDGSPSCDDGIGRVCRRPTAHAL